MNDKGNMKGSNSIYDEHYIFSTIGLEGMMLEIHRQKMLSPKNMTGSLLSFKIYPE